MKTHARMRLGHAGLALIASTALSARVIYDFTGNAYVGGHARLFTGVVEYEEIAASTAQRPRPGTVLLRGTTRARQHPDM